MRTIFLNIRGTKWLGIFGRTAALPAVIALCLTGASNKHQYSPHEKAAYADASLGESCTVCHQPGAAFDVNKVHAQY